MIYFFILLSGLLSSVFWMLQRKIWGFHGIDYEECRPLGYKNPVRTSDETHYVSVTEPSRLMLCKIRVSHGGDYEECYLLWCKTPVSTSQGTQYVSATVPCMLTLCKIWDFHGGGYAECRLLGYKHPVCTSQETHYVSATQPSRLMLCKIDVFTAVTKNAVFWFATACVCCKSRHFGGTYRLHHRGDNRRARNNDNNNCS
jgi:hypothetical protein